MRRIEEVCRLLWVVLFAVAGIGALLALIYLITRFHKFGFMQKLAEKRKWLSWGLAALPVAGLVVVTLKNMYIGIIVILHLALIWALCDLVTFIHRKRRHSWSSRYVTGVLAMLITAVYLGAGCFFAHHVFETDYRLKTKKHLDSSPLRVAMFADSHLGVTLDDKEFAEQMKRIDEQSPDVVIIAGDFVDDDSKRDDMVRACKALGEMKAKYGVIYVDGNHDKGYGNGRDFTIDELYAELEKNGVKILHDEVFEVGDVNFIGRKDHHDDSRLSAKQLMESADDEKYTIIIDHQPRDYEAEAAAGADLVLSGHTHGGHIFPSGFVGLAMGFNDNIYGKKVCGDTTFIVTSGISGWAIPFKTGCISEYVIIDVYDR
ncbi:MAG: metallophosphoesterase [Ruminococcus sp.]|nr:metallophosphoesterase [Ruminococcus sp.]